MTTIELIELLQTFDPDKRVVIWIGGWEELTEEDISETEHDDGYEGKVQLG